MKLPSLSLARIKQLFQAGRHPRPIRDWFILLSVAAVLVGLSVGWNAWSYLSVTTMTAPPAVLSVPHRFSTTTIQAVEEAFENRKIEADRYRSTYRFVDPSR